jgi:hypothetical protein
MISWVGQFGTITAPFVNEHHSTRQNIMIGQVEGGRSECLATVWCNQKKLIKL